MSKIDIYSELVVLFANVISGRFPFRIWCKRAMLAASSGSLTYTALLLPSETFNDIPQSKGLEEHPRVPNFAGNVVGKPLRLINHGLAANVFDK